MWKTIAGAALLLGVAGAAWGQSKDEIMAAAKEQVQAYSDCLVASVLQQAKTSSLLAEKVVDQAPADCIPERKALAARLRKPPLNMSSNKAEDEIDDALLQIRPQLLDAVKKARG